MNAVPGDPLTDPLSPRPYVTVAVTTEGRRMVWLHAPSMTLSAAQARELSEQLRVCAERIGDDVLGPTEG